jgi:DNA-binding beta-propeller fold protein YncE
MPAGYTPYNVEMTPDGRYALSVNQGGGLSGNVDTIVTIDAAANPPRVIDQTAVGDSPEGMAIGSNGVWVAVPLLKGSASKHDRWSYTKEGSLVLLSLSSDGKLQAVNELPTGGVPEGIAFSPDSHYVYVGNYIEKNLQVYRIAGGKLTDTGKTLTLPGQPASMRGLAR